MSRRPKITDAEFEVIHPGTRYEKPHWSAISWAEMSNADRAALVFSWCCAIGMGIYWAFWFLEKLT